MSNIPVSYLLEYVEAQIGNPYWYGTYGQILNASVWAANAKRYPKQFSDKRKEKARARGDYGKKGHDCNGLIKGARWTYPQRPNMPAKYVAAEDTDANGTYKACTERGNIKNIPEIPGLCVWRNNHIGVYMGKGRVIESKGFDYGTIESKLSEGTWTNWGKLDFVDYGGAEEAKPEPVIETPADSSEYVVKKGDTLSKIAKMWNTTVKAIADYNGIKNPNLIQIGQIIKKPMATAKPSPDPDESWIGIVNTIKDPLNIRAGAGMNYKVVGHLSKGSSVKLIGGSYNGWYKLADGRGYVSANLIKKS